MVPCQSVSKKKSGEVPVSPKTKLTFFIPIRKLSDTRLPPISVMDDFLPTRSWIPPISSSPDSSSLTSKLSSFPSTPQPTDQWKSPPYKNRNELSRDTSYTYYNHHQISKTSPLLLSSTSPILTSPPQQPSESPIQQQQQLKSPSYFQHNTSNNTKSVSPSPSYTSSTYTPARISNDIDEVILRLCLITAAATFSYSFF